MEHIHRSTGKIFDVSRLIDLDGKSHDINVITKWDEENDFEQSPVLVDYYFGDPSTKDTDTFIDEFIKRQNCLKTAVKFLEGKRLVDHEYMEEEDLRSLDDTINGLKNMITNLV